MGSRIARSALLLALGACGGGGHGPNVAVPDADPNAPDAGLAEPWRPTAAAPIHWHWQLSDDFVVPRDVLPHVTVYDIDGELTSAATVAALHALGPDVRVICYFDAGVYETYRSDKQRFIDAGLTDGPADVGWPNSFWIDIRKLDLVMPIVQHRMKDWCAAKGFDAIEPDETEVWANWNQARPTDLISRAANDAFQQAVSTSAHALGLSVGLKGNNSEAPDLEPMFDWALTEECWAYDECDLFRTSFAAADKMVLNVEYAVDPDCAKANAWHLNSSRRDLDLVRPGAAGYLYQPCVPDTQDHW